MLCVVVVVDVRDVRQLDREIRSRADEPGDAVPTLYAVGDNDAQVTDVMYVL